MSSPTAHRLADMTSLSFAEAATGNPVILLPLGSHEDHGPHLPMGDHVLADSLAARIAQAATEAGTLCFAAPSLPFGVADYFGAAPGGMAISAAAFAAVLNDLLAGLLRHNFTKILILNGHGGNAPVIHQVTLALKLAKNIVVPSFYLWKIARILMEARLCPGQSQRFGHGAEPLLSLSLALRPGHVQAAGQRPIAGEMLGLRISDFGTLDFQDVPIDVPAEFDAVPDQAIKTAWPLASVALGDAVADDLVAKATQFVIHFASYEDGIGLD